ncbi:S24/S26 family peptidase [Flavobacterium sp. AJR]|jgi:hypothetical protein|uniref:S24 family peptidase n=1 Tax=Flavobacterium sp. AJR TaxID=1979369 RepID=UPI000A3D77BD|nr:S24/S26 family peptidase [Flavobacterium sp. AJR]OUL63723.1 hypothetical protein B8T70_03785 [Flavobacterium sp. AJR]
MSDITLKINEIAIEYFSDNNSKFAKSMHTSEANIRNYRNGTLPKIDFIIGLAEKLEINFEWILLNKGKKNRSNYKNDDLIHTVEELNPNEISKTISVNESEKDNIVFVPIKDTTDYLTKYGDSNFIQGLPSYKFPNINQGINRMFQLDGHSMYPTLHDKSFVIGKWVDNWMIDIKDDRVYIIVSKTNGIMIRRVLNRIEKYGSLYCKSDNRREFPNVEISPRDIIEVWEYRMHLSSELLNPIDLYERVNDLEVKIMILENKTKK